MPKQDAGGHGRPGYDGRHDSGHVGGGFHRRRSLLTDIDAAVIGAGVTGLASACALSSAGLSVCLIERHPRAGAETSTHNSGVIHAGLYYPPGSLKGRLCVAGRERLYAFCAEYGIPHARCGKLVVAHDPADRERLEKIRGLGIANGVTDLEIVDREFIRSREPASNAVAALYSPSTGIVDADALIRQLLRLAQASDVAFLPGTRLASASTEAEGIRLCTDREQILAGQVVNAAGLYADDVSALLGGEPFSIYPCRGEYAELTAARADRINGLIYPLPETHGLGVHIVKTMNGAVWLGPTARFQARKDDYESNRLPVDYFLEPARRLLPEVTLGDLRLAGTGIRPKLHGPDGTFADFLIRRDGRNPRVIQAAGIESPGLTACLAVGQLVAEIASGDVTPA